ncbi:MAG TPA: hypothetical protein VF541_12745 [Longimicrobium sp.]
MSPYSWLAAKKTPSCSTRFSSKYGFTCCSSRAYSARRTCSA